MKCWAYVACHLYGIRRTFVIGVATQVTSVQCGNESHRMEWVMWKLYGSVFAMCFVPLFVFNLFVQIFLGALAKSGIATFSFRTALFWAITQREDININFYGVYMWSALILVRFFTDSSYIKFHENPSSGSRIFVPCRRTGGQAGRHDAANSFCKFANAPKN